MRSLVLGLAAVLLLTACDGLFGPDDDPRLEITAIAPAVLEPGGTATITGQGFSATAASNEVTLAGVPATVTGATGSELTVALPASGAFPCPIGGMVAVEVAVGERSASAEHPAAGAVGHTLEVGQAVTLSSDALGCNEILVPGRYVVTVFNTSTLPGSATAFQLEGSGDGPATAAAADPAAGSSADLVQSLRIQPARLATRPADPAERAHGRLMERNRDLLERLGPPRPPTGLSRYQTTAAPAAVGDLRTFRVPDLDGEDHCTEYSTVTARVVYSGERAVVWEDTAAPLAGTMGERWRAVGEEFDQVMYPVMLQYFGDPLAIDDRTDADGRLSMLFSEDVNDMEAGVAGFVFSGDFYTRARCEASNGGEIFYGIVPTETGDGFDGMTVPFWAWSMRSTVMHEVKHITSYAVKLRDAGVSGPRYEAQWLEESTARLAEEFYARALFGYGQNENVSYGESVYKEVRVGENWPEYDALPSIMQKHFSGLRDYMDATESLSVVGKANEDDASFYGSGWLFVRWALDQSGQDEAAFVRALLDEDIRTGVANIEARTGRSFRELLADFSLALAADDHPAGFTAADPAHTHPSWDTRDIFAGLHEDFGGPDGRYTRPWPLRSHTLEAGAFSASVASLQGGSTSVFDLTVPDGQTQLLRVADGTGGPTPELLGMAVLRVQ